MRSCFRLLRFTNGLANISNNSAFVIQFHTNYVRINDNKIRVLVMLCNRKSHFSGNKSFEAETIQRGERALAQIKRINLHCNFRLPFIDIVLKCSLVWSLISFNIQKLPYIQLKYSYQLKQG